MEYNLNVNELNKISINLISLIQQKTHGRITLVVK